VGNNDKPHGSNITRLKIVPHEGVVSTPGGWWVDDDPFHQFKLYTNFNVDNCVTLKPVTLNHDHLFTDLHGTIHLMRSFGYNHSTHDVETWIGRR
jgi:hypothetical protein